MDIRLLEPEHWPAVKRIYQLGIDTGQATFEDHPPATWEDWCGKFLADLSLVGLEQNQVLGWAAVSQASSRQVYRGVGEVSVYVDPRRQGRGIGRALLERIVLESEKAGFWTLQAGIFPENKASLELHRSLGFRVVGERKKIGRMASGPQAGQWRDVLLLERRSQITGVD